MTTGRIPFRLYFFWLPGCGHCKAQMPIIREFKRLHPATDGFVLDVNLDRREEILGFSPDVAPAFLLAVADQAVANHEGMLSLDRLERFVEEGRRAFEAEMEPDFDEDEEEDEESDDEDDFSVVDDDEEDE